MGVGFCLFYLFFLINVLQLHFSEEPRSSSENPNQRAFLCQTGIYRWVGLLACRKPQTASRGFLISALGRPNAREAGEGPGGRKRPSWGHGRL